MEEKSVNKNRTIMIAMAVAVALGCGCLFAGIAGFYAFITISSVKSSPTQLFPIQPGEEVTPQSEAGIGDPPSGALGNDILRHDAWQVAAINFFAK